MMNIEVLSQSGLQGLFLAVVVLVVVYLAKTVKLVTDGNIARLINLALSAMVSGAASDPGDMEKQITLMVCALASAGMHELFTWLSKKFPSAETTIR